MSMINGWNNVGKCSRVGLCPVASTSFLVMINDIILRKIFWVRKGVTLGIQVPLSGFVVRGNCP